MKTSLKALALAPLTYACAAVFAVAPVSAGQITKLLEAVQATGTTIAVDLPRICNDRSILGYYEYESKVIDQLTICIDNHQGDEAELRDTVLHETVHVVQTCNGGRLFSPQSIRGAAKHNEFRDVSSSYKDDEFDEELEARVIAREWDEAYVIGLINEHCYR